MDIAVIVLTILIAISMLVHVMVWRKLRASARDSSATANPRSHEETTAILDSLSLRSDQILSVISNGQRFYDYALGHPATDSAALDLLAALIPTKELGKILAHPRSSEKAKRTAQERLREEAERAAQETTTSEATSTNNDVDDGYECRVGGSSCCGRGQGPYYH